MKPLERIAYSPITKRAPLELPGGARMVVWTIVNIEEWDIDQAMPRTVLTPPAGGAPMPDIPNWAWHEYGNRVGFWRFTEILDSLKIKAALAINGTAVRAYEPISRAALERGWEFMGHGYTQRNMQKVENEREDIAKTTEAIRAFTGKRPRGWLGPGLTETWETPDLLAEAGYDYVADWVLDDQPAWLMVLVVNPYVMGAPHRAKYYRRALEDIRAHKDVLFWTGEQIADWYRKS